MLATTSFRLDADPTREGLSSHPVWASYTEPADAEIIASWGVDRAWLASELESFAGFAQGYTHPMFPVLNLSVVEQLSHVVFATDFSLANGREAFGFLAGTHAIAIFSEDSAEILNRNLREQSGQASHRLAAVFGTPVFPMNFCVRVDGSPTGKRGTIKPWW